MRKTLPLLLLSLLLTIAVSFANPDNPGAGSSKTALTEARYDRLMRGYVNKVKLAFVQPEEGQTLEMLKQYSAVFMQQSDALKAELLASAKDLPAAEVKALYERLAEKSRAAEMIALLFDERITGRMQHNPEIKTVMDLLHNKSLEIPNTGPLAKGAK